MFDYFIDNEDYPISSKGFLPTVVDIMVIWVKISLSSRGTQNSVYRELPCSSVVMTWHFHCRGVGLFPGCRTKIPQAVHVTKTNQKTNQENSVCGSHYYAILMFSFFFFKYLLIYLAVPGLSCGMWDLVPWWGIERRPPTLGARSLSHWTTREAPQCFLQASSRKVPQRPIVKHLLSSVHPRAT